MNRTLWILGFFCCAGLLLLSTLFYEERIVFSDAAFYIFSLVQHGGFSVFHSRIIAIFPETLPLAARLLHASLDNIALSYSIAFPLYSLIVFILCMRIDRTGKTATVLIIYLMLLTTETFYWMISELNLGLQLLCLWIAVILSPTSSYKKTVSIAILLIIIVFSHPFVLFAYCFLVGYFFLRNEKSFSTKKAITFLGAFFLLLVLKSIVFYDQYDKGSLGGLRHLLSLFPDYFSIHANSVLLKDLLNKYYWLLLSFLAIVAVYIYQREWKRLCLLIAFVPGLLFFINVCFPFSDTPDFYRENLYLTVAFCLAIPLVFEILPLIGKRRVVIFLLAIIVTGFIRIYNARSFYSQRIDHLSAICQRYKDEKIIIPENKDLKTQLVYTWATPFEFWLLSTIKSGRTASIIITANIPFILKAGNASNVFLNTWGSTPYSELPSLYFVFPDTVSAYKLKN
jgi:hypothetical protein